MTALDYVTKMSKISDYQQTPHTEYEALQELIKSHYRLREYNDARVDWWWSLPGWKRWIANWLHLHI